MGSKARPRGLPEDPELPAASHLLGRGARAVIDAALAPVGARLVWCDPSQVLYTPGRRIAVTFECRINWPDGAVTEEALVAYSASDGPPAGAMVVEAAGMVVGIWRYRHDPLLPGLLAATDPLRMRELLDEFGVRPGPVTLAVRAYRPGRRAVVHATVGTQHLFLKVVRPAKCEALHRVHKALKGHVPVPESLGWSRELGIVAIEPLPGWSLREVLRAPEEPLPEGAELIELLRAFDHADLQGRPRPSTTAAARDQAGVLSAVLPDHAGRVERFAANLGDDVEQPLSVVHGDFYEAQVLVSAGRISGLVDVDGAGPGRRIDDLATMLGHLEVLAVVDGGTAARARGYARHLGAIFGAECDPNDLRRRTAAVVFGLATNPFRTQQHGWRGRTLTLLALAERISDNAQSRRDATLKGFSGPLQAALNRRGEA